MEISTVCAQAVASYCLVEDRDFICASASTGTLEAPSLALWHGSHCDLSLQYESAAPTASSDRTCQLATVCNTTTHIETIPPSPTSDRVCTLRGSTTTSPPFDSAASSDDGDSTVASVPWWVFLIAFLGLLVVVLVGAVYAQRRRRSDSYDVAVMPYTINQTNAAFSPVTARTHAGSPAKLTTAMTGDDETFDEPAGACMNCFTSPHLQTVDVCKQ